MKKQIFVALYIIITVAPGTLFCAASDDTYENRLMEFNKAVQKGLLDTIMSEHERLRNTAQPSGGSLLQGTPAQKESAKNPHLLRLIAQEKPTDLTSILEMFPIRSAITSAIQKKQWDELTHIANQLEENLNKEFDEAVKNKDIDEIIRISLNLQNLYPSPSALKSNPIQERNSMNPSLLRTLAEAKPLRPDVTSLFHPRSDIAAAIRTKNWDTLTTKANELEPKTPIIQPVIEPVIEPAVQPIQQPIPVQQSIIEEEVEEDYPTPAPAHFGTLLGGDLQPVTQQLTLHDMIRALFAVDDKTRTEYLHDIDVNNFIEMVTNNTELTSNEKNLALTYLFAEQERRENLLEGYQHMGFLNENRNSEENEDLNIALALSMTGDQPQNFNEHEVDDLATALVLSLSDQPQNTDLTQTQNQTPNIANENQAPTAEQIRIAERNRRIINNSLIAAGVTGLGAIIFWDSMKNYFKK